MEGVDARNNLRRDCNFKIFKTQKVKKDIFFFFLYNIIAHIISGFKIKEYFNFQ